MPAKKTTSAKKPKKPAESVYIGTDKIEGYAKITGPDMDILSKRREAMAQAVQQANFMAVKQAYETGKDFKPEANGNIVLLSVRITPPVTEEPYTEATPQHLLPPEFAAAMRGRYSVEKFNIYVVSVGWTARWITVEPDSIEGLPSYPESKQTSKTRIGKTVFEFATPHPMLDKISYMEKTEHHVAQRNLTLKAFVEKYKTYEEEFIREFEKHFFEELNQAFLKLPKCPKECEETELSVTIGYPQPYQAGGKEVIIVRERSEMVHQPAPKVVNVKFEEYTFEMKGKWSWSMQRVCGID